MHDHLPSHALFAERARTRRADGLSPQNSSANTQCPVFLDADARFFWQWSGPCLPTDTPTACFQRQLTRASVVMIDLLHRADGIYNANFNGAIRLGFAGLVIQTTSNMSIPTPASGTAADAGSVLGGYEEWLAAGASVVSNQIVTKAVRGAGFPTSQQVCLNHFLTHIQCGTTLGVAELAAVGYAGGICDTTIFGNGGTTPYSASNTGFVTTLFSGGVVPHLQSVLVVAHEIGHNFGSPHDCSTDCTQGDLPCVPTNANGGTYIM